MLAISVNLGVMVLPQPAAMPHPDAHSLPHQWDQGENWKGKSQKKCGLRLRQFNRENR